MEGAPILRNPRAAPRDPRGGDTITGVTAALSLLLLTLPATPQGAPGQAFRDASEDYGVLFFDGGGSFSSQMGGGTAWFDCDGDGDDDLFVAHAGGANRLFRHMGDAFEDVTAGAGIQTSGNFDPMGASSADFDQDGRADVYLFTTGPNALFRNLGGGAFADVAAAAGVDGGDKFTTAASWSDFDLDGDLDLYVGNYIRVLNFPYHYGEPNQLFVNEGAAFVERAAQLGVDNSGVFGPPNPHIPEYVSPEGEATAGCTLSVATTDYDQDGYPDVQVGNDFGMWVLPNALYRNASAGGALAFDDVTAATGFDVRPQYNMGVNAADFDHDGDWDFYLSNLGDNVLLRNEGGAFVDATYELGPAEGTNPAGTALYSSWATVWADFDNDTWEDLFVVNGFIPAAPFISNDLREPNALWQSVDGQHFRRLLHRHSGLDDEGAGRGGAAVDVDGDGRIDLYTSNNQQIATAADTDASRLWVNEMAPEENGWVELRLLGRFSNLEGIGARLEAAVGGDVLRRAVLADTVYLSGSTKMVHFGLGTADRIDRLTVHWPAGPVQDVLRVPSGDLGVLREPAITVASLPAPQLDVDTLKLVATVENHAATPVSCQADFLLESDGGAAPVPIGSSSATVGPGAHTIELDVFVGSGLSGVDPAGPLNLILRVTAAGGTDDELVSFLLP